MDNAQLRVMKKKKNKKIASLDKKNKKNKNICHLGKRGCLIKNAKAWKKRHKNRQMMEAQNTLMVEQNTLMVTPITTDARMFLYFFVSPSGVFTKL